MNKKGFTLAELLIVVAIIAVLVAIAFPVFSSWLEKSREATDAANIRALYASSVEEVISNPELQTPRIYHTSIYPDGIQYYTLWKTINMRQKEAGWQDEQIRESLAMLFKDYSHIYASLDYVKKGSYAEIMFYPGDSSHQEYWSLRFYGGVDDDNSSSGESNNSGPNGTTDSWLTFDDTQLSSVVEVDKNLGGMYGYDGNIGKPLIGLNENEMEAEPDVIYKDSVGNYYTYTTSPYDDSGYYSWYKSTNGTFWTKET